MRHGQEIEIEGAVLASRQRQASFQGLNRLAVPARTVQSDAKCVHVPDLVRSQLDGASSQLEHANGFARPFHQVPRFPVAGICQSSCARLTITVTPRWQKPTTCAADYIAEPPTVRGTTTPSDGGARGCAQPQGWCSALAGALAWVARHRAAWSVLPHDS